MQIFLKCIWTIFHPDRLGFFVIPAMQTQVLHFQEIGWCSAQMSPHQPIGVNSITSCFKQWVKIKGIQDPDKFSGHGLGSSFLKKLYNSPEVRNVEVMSATRHNSISALLTYMQWNNMSEAGRFRALSTNLQATQGHHGVISQVLQPYSTFKKSTAITPFNIQHPHLNDDKKDPSVDGWFNTKKWSTYFFPEGFYVFGRRCHDLHVVMVCLWRMKCCDLWFRVFWWLYFIRCYLL